MELLKVYAKATILNTRLQKDKQDSTAHPGHTEEGSHPQMHMNTKQLAASEVGYLHDLGECCGSQRGCRAMEASRALGGEGRGHELNIEVGVSCREEYKKI